MKIRMAKKIVKLLWFHADKLLTTSISREKLQKIQTRKRVCGVHETCLKEGENSNETILDNFQTLCFNSIANALMKRDSASSLINVFKVSKV